MVRASVIAPARGTHAEDSLALGVLGGVVGFHVARSSVVTSELFERFVGKRFLLRKAEFSLLMLLLANEGVQPKRLTRTLGVTSPKLTLLLDSLQARGLVLRQPNPLDGRSQIVVLTPAGRRLANDASDAAAPMERDLTKRFSRAERAMLIELLEKLYA